MAISRAQLVKELEPGLNALFGLEYKQYANAVAYTHLTLPTIYTVWISVVAVSSKKKI